MADNTVLTLSIYEDEDMTVIRETKAGMLRKIPFGVVRDIAALFDLDKDQADTAKILATITTAWKDVTHILDRVFPGMTEDDWNHVDTEEVIRVLYTIIQEAMKSLLKVPVKNSEGN